MKKLYKNRLALLLPLMLVVALMSSCEDDDTGSPAIHYVRVANPESSDSLLAGAFLGDLIVVVGENLGGARELWFNDKQAVLIPTYITDQAIFVDIPNQAPTEVTNTIQIVFKDGSTLAYDFEVAISEPVLSSMTHEYAEVGSTTTITGDFFFEPITVSFTGNVEASVEVVDQNTLQVTIPEGAQSGPLTVSTNFGTTETSFHYKDERNIFLNYDDKNADGSWRPGLYVTDQHSLDGNYLKLSGNYSADSPREEGPVGDNHYESQFWGQAAGRPEGSLIPIPAEPQNYVLKFEAKVISWYASYLNICFSPWDNAGNQEVWTNAFNPRAIWGPWAAADQNFDTGGRWITVTIPLTDFMYDMDMNDSDEVEYTPSATKWNPDNTGGLSFWVLAAPMADNSPFEIYIDNVRIVEQ
ncbi:glycan-binding surface protein [Marinoscillum furvescens]|uniref:Surface glycan-binding protein B xyloglucan binding domain-containing protein n=1 Tax=Marinoscillum furvescens DSM 4134 TaxID=1122208 RepID=A0A3D9L1K3_MARFU|nr:glycan-binding surface protein [Marinoscillum furvescens]RED97928.1 hypothetical protein C7460_11169 [Marinoscillum furvescens DSM 4134]